MNGRRVFYLFLVLGLVSGVILWIVPGNKYEWMRTDPVVGSPSAKLPIDQDAWATLGLFAAPVLGIAVLNLVNALMRLRGRMSMVAIGFSLGLIGVAVLKLRGF